MTKVTWRVIRDPAGDNVTEPDLVDVEVTDAFNRFAREARAWMTDSDGTKLDDYPSGTRVDFEVESTTGGGYTKRFGGFVLDHDQQNAREVQIIAASFDHWLRQRQVYLSVSSTAVSSVLQTLIETNPGVAVEWNAAKVTVNNDDTITRDWEGERLDIVLDELLEISSTDEWGADDDGDFFFRPASTNASPRNFVEGEYAEAFFDRHTSDEVTSVTVFYDSPPNEKAVRVQALDRQSEVQTLIGSTRRPVNERTAAFPEITSEESAIAKARQLLRASGIQMGELETWAGFDVFPGDVAVVVSDDDGIDADFRVAEIKYRWSTDVTRVKLAENTRGVIDAMLSMSNDVTRVDVRDADTDATPTEVLQQEIPLDVSLSLEVAKRAVPADMVLYGQDYGDVIGHNPTGPGGRIGDLRGAETVVASL